MQATSNSNAWHEVELFLLRSFIIIELFTKLFGLIYKDIFLPVR